MKFQKHDISSQTLIKSSISNNISAFDYALEQFILRKRNDTKN